MAQPSPPSRTTKAKPNKSLREANIAQGGVIVGREVSEQVEASKRANFKQNGFEKVAVIVPAFCVEREIVATLDGIPSWVEHIFVVDDASTDRTRSLVEAHSDPRVRLISHLVNQGVGAAIRSGYDAALAEGSQVLVVMAGDNQMCPSDLRRVVAPVATGQADYVKGNRLIHPAWRKMPLLRRMGTRFLATWTNLLGGLSIGDSQCGYTALSAKAARSLPLAELWPRYGYPGHFLLTLAAHGALIDEVPVRPVYRSEKSGLRPYHVLYIAALVLARALVLVFRKRGPKGALQHASKRSWVT